MTGLSLNSGLTNLKASGLRKTFVFSDLERSHLMYLQYLIARHPARATGLYAVFVIFWLLALYGAGQVDGITVPAIFYVPHLGLFSMMLGIIVFPARLLFVPIAVFSCGFWGQNFLPDLALPDDVPALVRQRFLWKAYASNIFAGIVPGAMMRVLLAYLLKRKSAFESDLITALCAGLAMGLGIWISGFIFFHYTSSAFPDLITALGGDTLARLDHGIWIRAGYGCSAVTAIVIGAIQLPRFIDLARALPVILLFAVPAVAARFGISIEPSFDMNLLVAIVAILAPVRMVIPIIAGGTAIYLVITGIIVGIEPPRTRQDAVIQIYSVIAFYMVNFIFALRSYAAHKLLKQSNSVRRLNTVRNFARIGIFAIEVEDRTVHVDTVTQNILNAPPKFDLAFMFQIFRDEDREALRKLVFDQPEQTNITLHLRCDPDGDPDSKAQVVRLFLWYEYNSVYNQRIIHGLVVDTTTEHQQEQALQQALDEVSARQNQKNRIFSIISHELRTPAAIISMLVDGLNNEYTDLNGQKPLAHKRLRDTTDQLLGVLNDMRQAVNPEQNLPINRVAMIPADVALSLRNTFEIQASEANIKLSLRLGDGARETCLNDQVRVKQIIGNLVRNAIIHSQCQTITISYTAIMHDDQRHGVWTVTDDGRGIPPDQVERLFQPFERGTDDARNRPDGSGLGLYIVRSSVQLLNGNVNYFAAPEGGAGYRIALPEPLCESKKTYVNHGDKAQNLCKELTVILAEDTPLVAEITRARLLKIFKNVVWVKNGREALDIVDDLKPDLIITDLFMPRMSGDEMTRILREKGFDKLIIGLTAAVVDQDTERFESAGVSCVMSKPLDDKALVDFVFSHSV